MQIHLVYPVVKSYYEVLCSERCKNDPLQVENTFRELGGLQEGAIDPLLLKDILMNVEDTKQMCTNICYPLEEYLEYLEFLFHAQ